MGSLITDHCSALKVKDYLDMRGTQIIASASLNPDHPLYYMAAHQLMPKNIKTIPKMLHHTQILSSLLPCPPHTSLPEDMHNQITQHSITPLRNNTHLDALPLDRHSSESSLPQEERVHLARQHCGHHAGLPEQTGYNECRQWHS